jgi:hypothetical protein
MGNCTGVFSNCCGEDSHAIKRVDNEGMKKAIQANKDY